jgi:hypothetical protein
MRERNMRIAFKSALLAGCRFPRLGVRRRSIGLRRLKALYAETGSWADAVARYHSRDPERAVRYRGSDRGDDRPEGQARRLRRSGRRAVGRQCT